MTSRIAILVLLLAATGCADDGLFDPAFENSVDTLTIGSIVGTPISTPSAYSITEDRLVRTDQTAGFDFVYLLKDDNHFLLPLDAIGLGGRSSNPGLQKSTIGFDDIIDPPSNGYVTADSMAVKVGDVLVARSRIFCGLGVPAYAKLEILSFDDPAATMTFRVLADVNCGYRQLAPGLPKN